MRDSDVTMNLSMWLAAQEVQNRYDLAMLRGGSPAESERLALQQVDLLQRMLGDDHPAQRFADSLRAMLQARRQADENGSQPPQSLQ